MTTVLITGANSGIGSAAVVSLGAAGANVIATVRSDDSDKQLRSSIDNGTAVPEWLTIERLDVTDIEGGRSLMEHCQPDVLVNNAGSVLLGGVADVDFDEARMQFETSVLAPVFLARSAIETGSCRRVVNVGSVVAEGVIPFTGWYGAAKSALEVLNDVWRVEIGPRGVQFVNVECGAIDTDAWDSAGKDVAADGDPTTRRARQRWADATEFMKRGFGEPDDVAKAITRACLEGNPPATIRVGLGSLAIPGIGLLPRAIREPITRTVFGLKGRHR